MLAALEIAEACVLFEKGSSLPTLTSFSISGFDFLQLHTPLLTSFHLTDGFSSDSGWTTDIILNFLRNCPLLEVAFFSCDIDPGSNDDVSLPLLNSFTHKSPHDKYQLHLFNRLSLPSTCRAVLGIDVTDHFHNPWVPGLPTLRDSSYFSDVKTVKIAARSHNLDVREDHITFKIELVNPARGATSFDRISYADEHPHLFSLRGLLDILESVELDSVETLCFDHYPVYTRDALLEATIEHVTQDSRNFETSKP